MINRHDIGQMGKIAALALLAWFVPPRLWRRAASLPLWTGNRGRSTAPYALVFGSKLSDLRISEIIDRRRQYARELKFQILGLAGPWRGWHPKIRLRGECHLQAALGRGRGAVLWVVETSFSTLMVKWALHSAGHEAYQLSRPGHGFSNTAFGMSVLNSIWTNVENRFIAERVLITKETASDALDILRGRLVSNKLVIITFAPLAHNFQKVPFFQGSLEVPTGPVRFALATGSSLLPVFAYTTANEEFEIVVKKDIIGEKKNEGLDAIVTDYVKSLETFISRHPDQWSGWDWLPSRFERSASL